MINSKPIRIIFLLKGWGWGGGGGGGGEGGGGGVGGLRNKY